MNRPGIFKNPLKPNQNQGKSLVVSFKDLDKKDQQQQPKDFQNPYQLQIQSRLHQQQQQQNHAYQEQNLTNSFNQQYTYKRNLQKEKLIDTSTSRSSEETRQPISNVEDMSRREKVIPKKGITQTQGISLVQGIAQKTLAVRDKFEEGSIAPKNASFSEAILKSNYPKIMQTKQLEPTNIISEEKTTTNSSIDKTKSSNSLRESHSRGEEPTKTNYFLEKCKQTLIKTLGLSNNGILNNRDKSLFQQFKRRFSNEQDSLTSNENPDETSGQIMRNKSNVELFSDEDENRLGLGIHKNSNNMFGMPKLVVNFTEGNVPRPNNMAYSKKLYKEKDAESDVPSTINRDKSYRGYSDSDFTVNTHSTCTTDSNEPVFDELAFKTYVDVHSQKHEENKMEIQEPYSKFTAHELPNISIDMYEIYNNRNISKPLQIPKFKDNPNSQDDHNRHKIQKTPKEPSTNCGFMKEPTIKFGEIPSIKEVIEEEESQHIDSQKKHNECIEKAESVNVMPILPNDANNKPGAFLKSKNEFELTFTIGSSSSAQNIFISDQGNLNTFNKSKGFSSSYHSTKKNFSRETPINTRQTKSTMKSSMRRKQTDPYCPDYIIAILNNTNEVGMAAFNEISGEIIISQIPDNLTYINTVATMYCFQPKEIIISNVQSDTPLVSRLHEEFKNTTVRVLNKMYFNDKKGELLYKESPFNKKLENIESKRLGLAALHALSSFYEKFRNSMWVSNLLKITYYHVKHITIMDINTIRQLELIANNHDMTPKNSLFSLFNCLTIGGSRTLRSSIIQPLNNIEMIEERLDTVTEIITNPILYDDLLKTLAPFKECNTITAKFIHKIHGIPTEKSLKSYYYHIGLLYQTLYKIGPLLNAIKNTKSKILLDAIKVLKNPEIQESVYIIKKYLDLEPDLTKREIKDRLYFLLNKDVDIGVELARKKYCQYHQKAQEIIENYLIKLNSRDIKLRYNEKKGFFVSIGPDVLKHHPTIKSISIALGEKLMYIELKGKYVNFTTKQLISINPQVESCCDQIIKLTQRPLKELVEKIQKRLGIFFWISEIISKLDMLTAFAGYVLKHPQKCSRARLCKDMKCVYIQGGRNPVLEKVKEYSLIMPNDYNICNLNSIQIITGTNSSGKSAYIKQVALLCIMGQIGCYLPCDAAFFAPFHKIFSRIGSNDIIEENQSSLSIELTQIDYILSNIESIQNKPRQRDDTLTSENYNNQVNESNRCLILIDGFCKSSAFEDSYAFSVACLEEIIKKRTSIVMFVDTNGFLSKLKKIYNVIECLRMKDQILTNDDSDSEDDLSMPNIQIKHLYKAEILNDEQLVDPEKSSIIENGINDEFMNTFAQNQKNILLMRQSNIKEPDKLNTLEAEITPNEAMKKFFFDFCKIESRVDLSSEQRIKAKQDLIDIHFKGSMNLNENS